MHDDRYGEWLFLHASGGARGGKLPWKTFRLTIRRLVILVLLAMGRYEIRPVKLKQMPKPNVREKVVIAGLQQFHRLGFNGCSVEDITSLAGVPKGSFYNHFKSKEDLALEAIERFREAGLHKSLGESNRSPVKRLKEYFAFLSKAFTDSGNSKGCLFGNLANEMADHSPVIRERLKSIFASWTHAIASLVREGQMAGEITSPQKAERLAGFLLSAWEGTLVRARCTKDLSPIKDFNEVVFSQLLK